jgi:hypothetical protein
MLGGQKARGHCLEMICADFLAGATVGEIDSNIFSASVFRLLEKRFTRVWLSAQTKRHSSRQEREASNRWVWGEAIELN